jgi:hypothetical protein
MDLTSGVQTYEVRSFSSDRCYVVRQNHLGDFSCSCADFFYRKGPRGEACKHIESVLAEGLRRYHRFNRRGTHGARLLAAMEGATDGVS